MTPHCLGVLVIATASVAGSQKPTNDSPAVPSPASPEQRLSDTLKDVINKGADLYNPPSRDHNACYRLFQGALMVARIQLDAYPEVQKEIDSALQEAERLGPSGERAFALRKALDKIRTTIGQKPPSVKPADGKSDEKKGQLPARSSTSVTINGKPAAPHEEEAFRAVATKLIGDAFVSATNELCRRVLNLPMHLLH